MTITKSITLNGDGTLASTLASSGGSAIIINATNPSANGTVVILRNLSLISGGTGPSPAAYGIRVLQVGTLVVEDVTIAGFTDRSIDILVSNTTAKVALDNVRISGGSAGVRVATSGGGTVKVAANALMVRAASYALWTLAGNTTVRNSSISLNNYALLSEGASTLSVTDSKIFANGNAITPQGASTIRLSSNGIYDNTTAYNCSSGTLRSGNDNRVAGNAAGTMSCPNAGLGIQ